MLGHLLRRLRGRRPSALLGIGTRNHTFPTPTGRVMLLFGSVFGARWQVDLLLLVRFLALLLLVVIFLRIPLVTIFRAVLPFLGLLQSLLAIGYRMHLSEHLQNKVGQT